MAASAASITAVQKAYVAYYGRPADPAGLTYWSERLDSIEGEFSQMIEAFGSSDEATALFGSLENDAKINTIYQQIFGRDADAEGLAFYSAALTAGTMSAVTIAQNIIDGAANDDATIVANKLTSAQAFTDYLSANGADNYTGNAAAEDGRDWLGAVDATTESVTAATDGIAGVVTALEPAPVIPTNPGSTFTLTSADDDLTGTDKDDVFNARSINVGADDQINGGAGNDTFNVTVTGAVAAVEVDNVETVNFNIQAFAAPTIDLSNIAEGRVYLNQVASGYTGEVNLVNSDDLRVTTDNNLTTLNISAYGEGVIDIGAKMTTLDLSSDASEATLNLSNVATLTLHSADGLTDIVLNAVGDGVSKVDVNNSATFTGDIVLNGAVTLVGDSGALSTATIEGGESSILELEGATTAAFSLEDISVGRINVDVTGLTLNDAEGKAISLISNSSTLTVNTSSAGGTLDITVDANATTIDLTDRPLRDSTDLALTTKALTVTRLAVGGVVNADFQGNHTLTVVNGSTDGTLVATGSGNIILASVANVSTIDLSAVTGNVAIANIQTAAGGMVISTGSGADTVTWTNPSASPTLSTGAGNDVVTLTNMSTGDTFVDLGAGDDKVVFGTTFTAAGANTLVIQGGAGTDTLDFNVTTSVTLADMTTVLTGIEKVEFIGDIEVDAKTFNGQSGMTISATSATGEDFKISTAATDTKLDLSGITFDSTVDSVTVDLATTLTTASFSFIGSSKAETIATPIASTKAFSINAGGGNDDVVIQTSGATVTGGTITLGDGIDQVTIEVIANSVAGTSVLSDVAVLSDLVTVTDFVVGTDKVAFSAANALTITADVSVGAGLALADVATLTSVAQSATLFDDVVGYIDDGVIKLAGSDASNVNTLEEWMYVAQVLASGGSSGVMGFEFDGSTYITAFSVVTGGSTELFTLELDNVTGVTLGAGTGPTIVTISAT